MTVNNYFRFGDAVGKSRRSRGVHQQTLANISKIHGTQLSGIERGRLLGPSVELVRRLGESLKLMKSEIETLELLASHDRVMREIQRNFRHKHQLDLLAAALDAARVLSSPDCEALCTVISDLVKTRERLSSLQSIEKEAAMP